MRVYAGTVQQIIAAIVNQAATEIWLQPGTYEVSAAFQSSLNAFPLVTGRKLVIFGNSATIVRSPSASNFRFFEVQNAQLTLNNLTLRNGNIVTSSSDVNGGAVRVSQTTPSGIETLLTVQDCTFDANSVTSTGAGVAFGGAIGIIGFITSGGNRGKLVVRDSTFIGNHAYTGGALQILNVTAGFSNTTFEENSADSTGGAIQATGGASRLTISECIFRKNTATSAGAIFNQGINMIITASEFTENEAEAAAAIRREAISQLSVIQNCSIYGNLVTGLGNTVIQVDGSNRLNARLCWWGDASGPSGPGRTGSGDSVSTTVDVDPFYDSLEALHEGMAECPICYVTDDSATTGNPISLRLGEKRLQEIDLSLNTAKDVLIFERSYRQELLNDLDFNEKRRTMGLGWTHNHIFYIPPPVQTIPPQLQVSARLPEGGQITLYYDHQTNTDVHHYLATAGSNTKARVAYAGGVVSQIKIKTADRSKYIFSYFSAAQTCFLTERVFPSGERWIYDYIALADTVRLESVTDEFGCQLKFVYPSSGFTERPLQRVEAYRNGSLVSAVEYAYVPEMFNGSSIGSNAKPLLGTVTDVRGNEWKYEYYGSSSGETGTPDPLNYFKQRKSPPISSLSNQVIILEKVSYALNAGVITSIDQNRGMIDGSSNALLTTELQFHEGTNGDQTLEMIYGLTKVHRFERGVLAETNFEGFSGDIPGTGIREIGIVFRPSEQIDANGNATRIGWKESGELLDSVTDAVGATTGFNYEEIEDDGEGDAAEGGRLQAVTNALGAETQYFYDDRLRQPTLVLDGLGINPTAIRVDDKDTANAWTSANSGNVLSNVIWEKVGHGYHRRITTIDAVSGIQSNAFDITTGKNYVIKAIVRSATGIAVDVVVSIDGVGTLSPAQNVGSTWTEVTFTSTASSTMSTRLKIYLNNSSGGSFEIYYASVVEDNSAEKIDDMFFEQATTILSPSWDVYGDESPTVIRVGSTDAGRKSRYVKTNAASAGIESAALVSLSSQKKYLIFARVYPITGRVQMRLSTSGSLDVITSAEQSGGWLTLRKIVTNTSASGQKLRFLAYNAAAEFVVDTVHVIEFDSLQNWRDLRYDFIWRTVDESTVNIENASLAQQMLRTYDVSANRRGLLQMMEPVDLDGTSQSCRTIYSHDLSGRPTETRVTREPNGDCNVSYTIYDVAGNLVASIQNYHLSGGNPPTDAASAKALYSSSTPDRNIVTTHEYDELNRRISSTTNAGADDLTPPANFAKTSYTVYDELDRIVLTVANYVNGGAYDSPATWRWNGSVWKDDYGTGTTISHGSSASNDENIVSQTAYNPRGLVRLQRDVTGNTTLFGYDLADRLVKTVRSASYPNYDASMTDIALALYPGTGNPLSTAPDKDLISTQVYDAASNVVINTENPDFPDVRLITMNGYDPMNRAAKIINAASNPGYDFSTDHALAGYQPSSAVDEDIITRTIYDLVGRVESTIDATGTVNRMVYDDIGRVKYTIQNYVPQIYNNLEIDPFGWRWISPTSTTPGYWAYPTTASNTAPVDHGTYNDKNIISQTIYDPDGQVESIRDILGRLTYVVYDGLGRQVKSIANYVPQGTVSDWQWFDGDFGWDWYTDSTGTTLVLHGDRNDENLITESNYDTNGRVDFTRNPDGTRNLTIFDAFGKVLKTIQNAADSVTASSAAAWTWKTTNAGNHYAWCITDASIVPVSHGANDENIISANEYDIQSRVQQTRDNRGLVTRQVFDDAGRVIKRISNYNPALADNSPETWQWRLVGTEWNWYTTNDEPVQHGSANDQNIISAVEEFDLLGRVVTNRDVGGLVILRVYDALGRQIRSISNYVVQGTSLPKNWAWSVTNNRWEDGSGNAISHRSPYNDQNLISDTQYDKAGRVVLTRDPRGTATRYFYDRAGRQRTVTQAADTGLETTNYTCYDKAGRTLRHIVNLIEEVDGPSPDERDSQGNFLFNPDQHGIGTDQNLITFFAYDGLGRQIETVSPVGSAIQTLYGLDGQIKSTTEIGVAAHDGVADVTTQFRYDGVGRRTLVVQAFLDDNYDDPEKWVWDGTEWLDNETGGMPIAHDDGVHTQSQDRNLIVQTSYDLAGRMIGMRTPAGVENAYCYDKLGRRTKRVLSYTAQPNTTNPVDPADWFWSTANAHWEYSTGNAVTFGAGNDENMILQVEYSDPEAPDNVTGESEAKTRQPDGTVIFRRFDHLNRPLTIVYNDSNTPDVSFVHDVRSNRTRMIETVSAVKQRETFSSYDLARRLIKVEFDTDGDNIIDENVEYSYDLGGQRTQLAMPGDHDVDYTYDVRGQVRTLTDWDDQTTQFSYDAVGRHTLTQRANGLRSMYRYDAAGRLRLLRHIAGQRTFAQFAYEVDARGNRIQAFEAQRHPGSGSTIIDQSNDSVSYDGAWSTVSGYRVTSDTGASLHLIFAGNENVELTVGEGPDHGRFDIYIGGSLWETIDGYAASAGERVIPIPLFNDGPFALEMINRADHGPASSGNTLRFKQLSVDAEFTLQTIKYAYDTASRVLDADYYSGENTASTPVQMFTYSYDAAGNLTNNNGMARTFNKVNQLIANGTSTFTYDRNGNLTSDSLTTYGWDRANRLLNVGNDDFVYKYDGMGNRVSQTVSATPDDIVTSYLLDLQPSLVQVIAAKTGLNAESYLHSLRGIHAVQKSTDDWHYTLQDGLGSARSELGSALSVGASGAYQPYGVPTNIDGTFGQPFRFTGEMRDENALQYHRARYYSPALGNWISQDPFEGLPDIPFSLNLYNAMGNNPINWTDALGLQPPAPGITVIPGAPVYPASPDIAQLLTAAAKGSAPGVLAFLLAWGISEGIKTTDLEAYATYNAGIQAARDASDASKIFQPSAVPTAIPFPRIPSPSGNAPFGKLDWGILGLIAGLCITALEILRRSKPQDYDFDPEPDCDQGRSPRDAASDYAKIANEYYVGVQRAVGKTLRMTFAVTRVRYIATNTCHEVVGLNDNVEAAGDQRTWLVAYPHALIIVEGRQAYLQAGTGIPGRNKEHAEFNLINSLAPNGYDRASFRAMGVSQKPCDEGNPHNCSLHLREKYSDVAIAWYDWRNRRVEDFKM